MQAVQSSPDLLPASTGQQQQQQQQQESGSPLGAPLVKIKSLPAHYPSPGRQQQQQQLGADGFTHSASSSPVLTSMHMAAASAAGTGHSSRSPLAGPAHDAAAAAAGSVQQQQQHGSQVARGVTVSDLLRQQLVAAGGRVGVVHLALHATEAGLVAGWQQQLAAVLEPGGLLGSEWQVSLTQWQSVHSQVLR